MIDPFLFSFLSLSCYRAVDENTSGTKPSADLQSLFNELTGHLVQQDVDYFSHWMTCMFLEDEASTKKDKAQRFWLKSPQQR